MKNIFLLDYYSLQRFMKMLLLFFGVSVVFYLPPLTLPLFPGNSACYTAGDGEVTLLGNVTSAEAQTDHVNITLSGETGVTTRVTLLCGNSLVSTLQLVFIDLY